MTEDPIADASAIRCARGFDYCLPIANRHTSRRPWDLTPGRRPNNQLGSLA